ncbi:hypothetical protein Enr8_28780 [Blastopirellula retiformator]|uniref:Uncharacterized protein n=2 Tax=Blastopirellula retiformator TaxID=2527970 RepID=A0A5C5V3D4_9BACT|nr:hypothetical protein Enr8_28780 [Blastopirellula retiformator]
MGNASFSSPLIFSTDCVIAWMRAAKSYALSLARLKNAKMAFFNRQLGMPFRKRAKMVGYVFFDLLVGIIPFVGDLFDAAYKSNNKILKMLEDQIAEHGDATVNPASQMRVPNFVKQAYSAQSRRK